MQPGSYVAAHIAEYLYETGVVVGLLTFMQ